MDGQALRWSHFSDVPLGSIDEDRLWDAEGLLIRDEIGRIAQRAIAPLLPDQGSSAGPPPTSGLRKSIVYAVHGGWGSGKSSFLRMVAKTARQHAGSAQDRLVVVEYDASVYQSVQASPSITLAMALLEQLGGGDDNAARVFRNEQDDDIESVASRLAAEVRFPKHIERELSRNSITAPGTSRVALVLIDELDRCHPEFIYDVLRTVRHWSQADGLVFLLAVSEEPLRRTIEQQSSVEAGFGASPYALQKYIQHAVTLPGLNALRLKPLLDDLLRDDSSLGARAIADGMVYLQLALRDGEFANPRAVKRCLNEIYPLVHDTIARRLEDGPPRDEDLEQDEQNRVVKERVLAYRWREFYGALVYPALKDEDRQALATLQQVEQICSRHARPGSEDWELLDFELERLNRWHAIDHSPLSRQLLSYLSLPPYFATWDRGDSAEFGRRDGQARHDRWSWLGDSDPSEQPNGYASSANDSGRRSGEAWTGMHADKSSLSGQEALEALSVVHPAASEQARQVRREYDRLYYEGEAYEAARDRESTLSRVRAFLQLVKTNWDIFRREDCARVGNAALTAERFEDVQLAFELYETARKLDPDHPNNLQNYVDFIVEKELEQLYDLAETMLHQLQHGSAARHKPERTLSLQAQLASHRGAAISENLLDHLIEDSVNNPGNLVKYARAMEVFRRRSDFTRVRRLASEIERALSSDVARYPYLRGYADVLAASDQWSDECEAMEIYRQLITEPQSDRDLGQTLSNYALLLQLRGYYNEAAKCLLEAYRLIPGNEALRSLLAEYLIAGRHPELLNTILEGQELHATYEEIARPGGRPLPEGSFCTDPRNAEDQS